MVRSKTTCTHSPIARALAMFLAVCLWVCGGPGGGGVAVAAEPSAPAETSATAAILPISVAGELSDADRVGLTQQLVDGLERGDFAVISPASVLATNADAAGCEKAKCLRKIAKATGATHVVRTRIEIVDRDYTVSVELFDGSSGASVAKTTEGCEICGVSDAASLVGIVAATLRTKLDALAKGPSTLVLSSDPAGAEVRIDGDIAGTTPLERPVVPGKALIRVTKEGFIAVEREVTFVEGVTETVTFELEKVPSRLPSRPWGWVSLGVGIAGLAGAATFAVLDAREVPYKLGNACEGDNLDGNDNCRSIWNAPWHILGLGVAGASLTTLGIAVLLNSRARKRESGDGGAKKSKRGAKGKRSAGRRPRMGIGPTSVTLSGRF